MQDVLKMAQDYIEDGSLLPQDMSHPYFRISAAIDEALIELEDEVDYKEIYQKQKLVICAMKNNKVDYKLVAFRDMQRRLNYIKPSREFQTIQEQKAFNHALNKVRETVELLIHGCETERKTVTMYEVSHV